MMEAIHLYMKCSITIDLTITDSKGCKHSIGTQEIPIQDTVATALKESGHWMFG